jgi:hypothetical protein
MLTVAKCILYGLAVLILLFFASFFTSCSPFQ